MTRMTTALVPIALLPLPTMMILMVPGLCPRPAPSPTGCDGVDLITVPALRCSVRTANVASTLPW